MLDYAGGIDENATKVISGGPMMGKAISNLDIPVTKGTSGIVVLSKKEGYRKNKTTVSVVLAAFLFVRWG